MDRYTKSHPGAVTCCLLAIAASLIFAGSGCVAFHTNRSLTMSSVDHAIPARRLPPEMRAKTRSEKVPLNFGLLRQTPPERHIVGPGDVLGLYITGIMPTDDQLPSAVYPPDFRNVETPAVGAPTNVSADGTLTLPLVGSINVNGMDLLEVEAAIRAAYTKEGAMLLGPRSQVIVTLIRPRFHSVFVIRGDSDPPLPVVKVKESHLLSRHGSGQLLELPYGENDVLHALVATGGLPGTDAHDVVWVLRRAASDEQRCSLIVDQASLGAEVIPSQLVEEGMVAIPIPLRVHPGEPLPFKREDVILQNGDIVFIESRERELFYSGGLLDGGELVLPRDYDIDVVDAIAMANGNFAGPAGRNAAGTNFRSGPGNIIGPSRVIIVRDLHDGRQIKIHVDLKKALNDPLERVVIQPGDMVILAYTPFELCANVALNYVNVSYIIPND